MPKKFLIINIYGIGDVLFTYPMIKNIKAADPNAHIGYLCNIRTAPLLKENADVDKLFVYEKDEHKRLSRQSKRQGLKYVSQLFREIKEQNYDIVFDLSLNRNVSLFCWFLGIKKRIGLDYKRRSCFLSKKIPLFGYEGRHVVEYYLDLLRAVQLPIVDPYMFLSLPEETLRWASEYLAEKGINRQKILIGLVPGGGDSWGKNAKWKRWPKECFAKLADKLIEKYSADIILLGGKKEQLLCSEVQKLMKNKCFSACGQSTILQFAALANKCNLVVVNDGGPLHIAAASGARTVSVFGPVDEEVYGPYTKEKYTVITSDVFCRPCYRKFRKAKCSHFKCLKDITVETVFSRISKILEKI